MVRLVVLSLLAACSARPDRVDPADYPAADAEDITVPTPNNCDTLAGTFQITASGWLETTYEGFATFEYRSSPNRQTTLYFTPCGGDTDATEDPEVVAMAINFFGAGRLEQGEHPFTRLADVDGGANFTYTESASDTNCVDQPAGTLEVTSSTFSRVKGSFDVTVGCLDPDLLGRIPRETTFRGSFEATNIGKE